MNDIKAVIFDWGGVLIDDPAPALMSYCADRLGLTIENYIQVHNVFQDDFQKGLIEEKILWGSICEIFNIEMPTTESLWEDAFTQAYKPKQEVYDLAVKLKSLGYKIGFLSNTELPCEPFFNKQCYDIFDVKLVSCYEKMAKPDEQIYLNAIEKLAIKPQQAVLIDDREDYRKGAANAGLNTIQFENIDKLKEQLELLGIQL